jgi:hypothetical protein
MNAIKKIAKEFADEQQRTIKSGNTSVKIQPVMVDKGPSD